MTSISAILQARMNSTRLPGKSLSLLAGIPLIEHIINRLKAVTDLDHIVLAIPDSDSEYLLIEKAKQLGITVIKGPEEDVLKRFLLAAKQVKAQHIVRVCGDDPLIDRQLMKSLIDTHLKQNADYTVTSDSIPLGTGTEVARVEALKQISQTTVEPKYREHVTTWFHDNPTLVSQSHVPAPAYLMNKSHRLTVDTRNDLTLMEKIFDEFYSLASPLLDLEKVIQFLDARPDVSQINADTPQKNWQS